jgi:hypothetical protein
MSKLCTRTLVEVPTVEVVAFELTTARLTVGYGSKERLLDTLRHANPGSTRVNRCPRV